MSAEAPSHRYYRTKQGRWTSRVAFEVTDWPAFWACRMSLLDRARILYFAWAPKIIGDFVMDTSIDYSPAGLVHHTTRVSRFGMTYFRSEEELTLESDGARVTLTGGQRMFPTLWIARGFGAAGAVVSDDAKGARYELDWIGGRLVQTTRDEPDGLKLTQETPWSRATMKLRAA